MDLREFLRLPHRWRWGGVDGEDCTTYPASWVLARHLVDPAAGIRGTYDDEAGARQVLARFGGVEGVGRALLEPLGFARISEPGDGDIGIVRAEIGIEPVLGLMPAIRFGPLWSVMSARGPVNKHLEWAGVAWRTR